MKLTKTANTKIKPGMTLIEITVVILVLLTLISVLFIGANIYKKGADRAACILNIRNVHQAVRAEQNLNGRNIGDALVYNTTIYSVEDSSGSVTTENYLSRPVCPTASGSYTDTNDFPDVGAAAVFCAEYNDGTANGYAAGSEDSTYRHNPESTNGW